MRWKSHGIPLSKHILRRLWGCLGLSALTCKVTCPFPSNLPPSLSFRFPAGRHHSEFPPHASASRLPRMELRRVRLLGPIRENQLHRDIARCHCSPLLLARQTERGPFGAVSRTLDKRLRYLLRQGRHCRCCCSAWLVASDNRDCGGHFIA